MHFLDIDENVLAAGAFLQLRFQLVDFRALAPDDDPGPRRLDDDAQLVTRTLNLDCADARRLELLLQLILQLHVLVQLFVVIPLRKPARLPRLRKPKPESVRMDFLSHLRLLNCLPSAGNLPVLAKLISRPPSFFPALSEPEFSAGPWEKPEL